MFKLNFLKRLSKGFVSVLLVLTVMLSLAVPFNITAFAEGEAATGDNIYAYLKKIGASRVKDYNLELVFSSSKPAAGTYEKLYTNFADTSFVTTSYKFDDNCRPTPSWNFERWDTYATTKANLPGWLVDSVHTDSNGRQYPGYYIRKVTFKDKIAPKSIAGWFYGCSYLCKIVGLKENLDTSQCENMSFAFWRMNNGAYGSDITDSDGSSLKNAYLKTLDLSNFDTSNVKRMDCFVDSNKLENLIMPDFKFEGIENNVMTVAQSSNYHETNGVRDKG